MMGTIHGGHHIYIYIYIYECHHYINIYIYIYIYMSLLYFLTSTDCLKKHYLRRLNPHNVNIIALRAPLVV